MLNRWRIFFCMKNLFMSATTRTSTAFVHNKSGPILVSKEDFTENVTDRRPPLNQNELNIFVETHSKNAGGRNSATLVIFVDLPSASSESSGSGILETCIILTHRAAKMKHHANEISIPGGAIEESESAENAAIREAEEEIGLSRKEIDVWGKLPPLFLPTRKDSASPFISAYTGDTQMLQTKLKPAEDEVQGIFLVPLRQFLDGIHFTTFRVPGRLKNGLPLFYRMPAFIVDDYHVLIPSHNAKYLSKKRLIWGLTAVTLHETLLSILPAQERRKILP